MERGGDMMQQLQTHRSKMWQEIGEQPLVIRKTIERNQGTLKKIAERVKERKIRTIVLVGRGSSEHANQVGKYLFETYCGMVTSIATPSVVTKYDGKIRLSETLTIGVSQSGGARDVYEVMKKCEDEGGVCVSITNERDSLMSDTGDFYLNCECDKEESITATKSYMAQVTLLLALASYISENQSLLEVLDYVPTMIENSLQLEDQIRSIIPLFRNTDRILILARGLLYAVGLESELKIQETSYVDARCYASSDYQHGPIATTNRFVPTLFFVADEKTDEDTLNLRKQMVKEKKISSVVVTNNKRVFEEVDVGIQLPSDGFGNISAMYSCIVFSQMFACLLSIARGYNPDEPVGVSKKTVTL